MARGFFARKTTCGLCGKFFPLVMRTHAKDGIICRDCERRLRPSFPKYEGYRELSPLEQGYTGYGRASNRERTLIGPIEDVSIGELERHLRPARFMAEEREPTPVEDKDAYTVVLANIRRGQAVPVTKAVVDVCGIPLKEAWEFADKLPVTLGTNVSRGEAQR